MEIGVPKLSEHFALFGMEIHVGNALNEKSSKSEILFVAAPEIMYRDPETFDGQDLSNIEFGNDLYMPVVASFKYLGSVLTRNCRDDEDVALRLKTAGNVFGALRKSVFSSAKVSYDAKKVVYEGLILSILLYGSESWCLTERLYNQLRRFHSRCLRSMCRVNMIHTRLYRISTAQLLQRIDLLPVDVYITRRQLRWAGHVARMEME